MDQNLHEAGPMRRAFRHYGQSESRAIIVRREDECGKVIFTEVNPR